MKKLVTFLLLLISISVFAQDDMFIHTVTADNVNNYYTTLDHPSINGNSEAKIVYSNRWEGVYNNNATSLWYDGSYWNIFCEDTTADMPLGAMFNVYIASSANFITHIASVANQGTSDSYTVIDDTNFNNENPGPYAILSHYYNPNGVINNHNYGFWYDDDLGRRIIYTESGLAIPENAAFNILINGSFNASFIEHQALASNISSNWTIIDNALLNNNPDAAFVFSHYWGMSDYADSDVIIDKVLGAWYNGTNWSIYTEDSSAMPEGVYFDIIMAPQAGLSIKNSILDANLEAFPNPTSDFVTIKTITDISTITVYNLLGEEVATIEGKGTTMQIDLSNFQAGAYFAKVQAGNQVKTLKLIKE